MRLLKNRGFQKIYQTLSDGRPFDTQNGTPFVKWTSYAVLLPFFAESKPRNQSKFSLQSRFDFLVVFFGLLLLPPLCIFLVLLHAKHITGSEKNDRSSNSCSSFPKKSLFFRKKEPWLMGCIIPLQAFGKVN